jgi:hypothetical protein
LQNPVADAGRTLKETAERISRGGFIRLGAALGMGIAGASALAACGEEPAERSANGAADTNKIAARASGGKAAEGRPRDRPDIQSTNRLGRELRGGGESGCVSAPANRGVRCLLGRVHSPRVHGCLPGRTASLSQPWLGLRSVQRGSGSLWTRSLPVAADTDRIPIKVQRGGVYRA